LGDGVAVRLAELEIVDVDEIVARADNVADTLADAEADGVGENDAIAVSVVVPEKEGDADQLGPAE
jgi:hypothetical protein